LESADDVFSQLEMLILNNENDETEATITNGQSRDIGNIVHTRHKTKIKKKIQKKNTTQHRKLKKMSNMDHTKKQVCSRRINSSCDRYWHPQWTSYGQVVYDTNIRYRTIHKYNMCPPYTIHWLHQLAFSCSWECRWLVWLPPERRWGWW
jgi:hypothetical protein